MFSPADPLGSPHQITLSRDRRHLRLVWRRTGRRTLKHANASGRLPFFDALRKPDRRSARRPLAGPDNPEGRTRRRLRFKPGVFPRRGPRHLPMALFAGARRHANQNGKQLIALHPMTLGTLSSLRSNFAEIGREKRWTEIKGCLHEVEADILVIGGGTAGPMAAAWPCKNPDANVVLLKSERKQWCDIHGNGRTQQLGHSRHAPPEQYTQ